MLERDYQELFSGLTTPHLADACLRAEVPVRAAPAAMRPLLPGRQLVGPVLPARHVGSVDIFLEALETARPGDVLVVDNAGRLDEGCVGDLMGLEATQAGLSGLVIWGLHRDSAELREIGVPVFSLGAVPNGPLRLDPRAPDALQVAQVGSWVVSSDDLVLGDDDGVLFLPAARAEELTAIARAIREKERRQAERIRTGTSFRSQVRFAEYLARRQEDPSFTFRQHLRQIGGAIEE